MSLAWKLFLRIFGLGLFILIITYVDLETVWSLVSSANIYLLSLAVLLYFPHIFVKAFRWKFILQSWGIDYSTSDAYLAYQGSIFIGLLTPGKLGEFAKIVHITEHKKAGITDAFLSVILDRVFDLSTLLFLGLLGILVIGIDNLTGLVIFVAVAVGIMSAGLFLFDKTFYQFMNWITDFGKIGNWLARNSNWIFQIRNRIKSIKLEVWLVLIILTFTGNTLFFLQSYLAASALGISAGFMTITFATALGSVIALIPISVSGIGTRDMIISLYLNSQGISLEASLSFSVAIFLIFYIAGGIVGAVAWQLKPLPISELKRLSKLLNPLGDGS